MIGAFYGLGTDTFSSTEDIWEGVLGIIASIIITIMGAALLRVSKLQDKWRIKLARALEPQHNPDETKRARVKRWLEKYVMFTLPFITVLREGLEAVVYVGGVGLGLPATSFPLAVVCGLLAGVAVGYIIYRYVFHESDTFGTNYCLQRWKRDFDANLPDYLNLLPLPCCRRAILTWCLVPRKQYLEPYHWRRRLGNRLWCWVL
jgi:uncharacterized membrane-anchored protein YhcB (DUF1043 family)